MPKKQKYKKKAPLRKPLLRLTGADKVVAGFKGKKPMKSPPTPRLKPKKGATKPKRKGAGVPPPKGFVLANPKKKRK